MGKYKAKTAPTAIDVEDFIAAVENDTRRADAQVLVKLFEAVTGMKPKMWGPTIVGFGAYHYTYASGHSGTTCAVGFSPRKSSLVLYLMDFPDRESLLATLGKHKGGTGQCLYVNRLADVDLGVLRSLIKKSLAEMRKMWPVNEV